jgi:predicted neutral ceramidase superfamily lipid hydrolase
MVVAKKYSKQIISCISEENRKIQINHWFGYLQVLYLAILATLKTSIFSHCRWHAASVIMDVALLYSLNFLLCFALSAGVLPSSSTRIVCMKESSRLYVASINSPFSLVLCLCESRLYYGVAECYVVVSTRNRMRCSGDAEDCVKGGTD